MFERLGGGIDWTDLAQDRDRWRVLVNMMMNLRVPSNTGNFVGSLCHVDFSATTLPRYGPEVDTASNTNEYQGFSLGVKTA
jgi:hypothetical protein